MTKVSRKIMVVEDEVLVGIMLVRKLQSFGYAVEDAITTGEDAVVRAKLDRPEVILMDVTLAGNLTGLQAARQIKDLYGIPIILFSGYDKDSLAKEAAEIDPVAIVSKMGSMEELQAAIEKAINIQA